MPDSNIWKDRLQEYGHTGWSDPFIYVYDQLERLKTVSDSIDKADINPVKALDFGCGTGDFTRMLIKKGFRVDGHDPYVNPKIKDQQFTYISDDEFANGQPEKYGLIISITVLAHILDRKDIISVLEQMRKQIVSNGKLFILEYAIDEGQEFVNRSKIQVIRKSVEWKELFKLTGWEIENIEPISYPIGSPSQGYLHFNKQFLVRGLKMLIFKTKIKFPFLSMLKFLANQTVNKYHAVKIDSSPLKLMQCKPIPLNNL